MDYLRNLTTQFSESTGIPIYTYETGEEFRTDLFKWINIRDNISKSLAKYLEQDLIDEDSYLGTFEIDKGKHDSLFSYLNIKMISRYINEDDYDNIPLVCNGEFKIIEKEPIIKLPSNTIITLEDIYMDHIFTTNPYNMNLLKGWDDIINSGIFSTTIGIYGSVYDLDMNDKIRDLEIFKERLYNCYDEIFETDNGAYFYLLTNKNIENKEKVKIKTLM